MKSLLILRIALRRIKPVVPLCTLVTLYRSLIQLYFNYRSPLWDTCCKQRKDKLQTIQNRAGRIITGSSYEVRSADVLNNLKRKTLETRLFLSKVPWVLEVFFFSRWGRQNLTARPRRRVTKRREKKVWHQLIATSFPCPRQFPLIDIRSQKKTEQTG